MRTRFNLYRSTRYSHIFESCTHMQIRYVHIMTLINSHLWTFLFSIGKAIRKCVHWLSLLLLLMHIFWLAAYWNVSSQRQISGVLKRNICLCVCVNLCTLYNIICRLSSNKLISLLEIYGNNNCSLYPLFVCVRVTLGVARFWWKMNINKEIGNATLFVFI